MLWFKHDSNAHRDAKLKKVIIKYGMSGYGMYWYLLEEIANGITPEKFTFHIESDAEIISHDTGISAQLVSEMMAFMVDLRLFENNSGLITCLKMLNRLDSSMTSNQHMRNIISRAKSTRNHDNVMMESCHSHDGVMIPSPTDKSRVDKIRTNLKHMSSPMVNDDDVFTKIDKKKDSPDKISNVPYQQIVDLYHSTLTMLPRVEKLTAARKAQIRQRWVQDLPDLFHWENYFDHVKQSKFLTGMSPVQNGRKPFKATLEWLTKESNFVKVSEEKYHG